MMFMRSESQMMVLGLKTGLIIRTLGLADFPNQRLGWEGDSVPYMIISVTSPYLVLYSLLVEISYHLLLILIPLHLCTPCF